ncbi:putative inactive lipase [Corynebacterium capitovis DSM 44611]|uniref:lipase family protein n=1 Tax=Corynebacterium capitovis TaxID=131081 RepID=UPI0003A68D26|nr:lipase family protein [Corynebacterium capitovis]WKD57686.1 putative inactive lipase [Corynebacterium capitovis DSM 44611]
MLSAFARATVPLLFDATRAHPGTDPEFGHATWLVGTTPGQLLQSHCVRAIGLGSRLNPARAWRIDYATSDAQRRVVSATGAVFRSLCPWRGHGPRPTVAFAPSTQGVAPRCDPSYSCTVGVALRRQPLDLIASYEQPTINLFLAAGCNVVLTDYPREPESGVQLYCDHLSAARALADALRAAAELGIGSDNLGLWGFSQGGGAIGAWLENSHYAPELQPLAAVIGSPPANLAEVLDHVDGSLPSTVILYAVAGMMAADPGIAAEIAAVLSPSGLAAIELGERVCAVGAVAHTRWRSTREWTQSGLRMSDTLEHLPRTRDYLDRNVLGRHAIPDIPVRFWAALHDDVVPFSSSLSLARAWGVKLAESRIPRVPGRSGFNHFAPYYLRLHRDARWLVSQLGG